MEKKYESLTLFEFQEKFPDNDSCQEYLSELKWPKGLNVRGVAMTGIAVGSCSIHGNALNASIRLLPLVAPYSTRLNSHF